MVALSTTITQRLVYNEYEQVNGRNDRSDFPLNPLQREYYFIKYGKSYVINCNYCCFWSTATL